MRFQVTKLSIRSCKLEVLSVTKEMVIVCRVCPVTLNPVGCCMYIKIVLKIPKPGFDSPEIPISSVSGKA